MRAASQASAALDAPSTSGRCAAAPCRTAFQGQTITVPRAHTHNQLGMYNTQPLPDYRPDPPHGVVAGVRTTATPLLGPERVLQLLADTVHPHARINFGAFFSSELGGIVTEPGFMVVNIDDHMVHRGDAVAEEVQLVEGYLYQLDARVERFLESAELAGLPLPFGEARLRRVLLDTAAASLKMNGMLSFWLSRGRGGFGLGGAIDSSFYALLNTETAYATFDRENGLKAYSTPLPARSPYFTAMRNVSLVESSVAHYEAMARGGDLAVFLDPDGSVVYGSNCSLGLLTHDHTLVLPLDEGGLANMAVRNLARHTMKYKTEDEPDLLVERIEQRIFSKDEVLGAQEAFAISTRMGVVGLSHLDDAPLGAGTEYEGTSGPVSLALNELLVVEALPRPGPSDDHTEVPYGYLTGMKAHLI